MKDWLGKDKKNQYLVLALCLIPVGIGWASACVDMLPEPAGTQARPETPASPPPKPVVVTESGTGPGRVSMRLPRGRFRVEIDVGNNYDELFGSRHATNAIFDPQSMSGDFHWTWLNTIGGSASTVETFEIHDRKGDEIWVRVDVAQKARWSIHVVQVAR